MLVVDGTLWKVYEGSELRTKRTGNLSKNRDQANDCIVDIVENNEMSPVHLSRLVIIVEVVVIEMKPSIT